MTKLGINFPGKRGDFPKLDDATKQKLAEIRQKVKDGTLTKEQAQEEMSKLGIKFPLRQKK